MIKKEELYRVFNVFLNNKSVTEDNLLRNGIDKKCIDNLLDKGVISKLGVFYILKRKYVGELSNYGNILINNGDFIRARKCFQFCSNLSPDVKKYNFYKFAMDVKFKDYEEAISYFEDLLPYSLDDMFSLYMLSLIVNVGGEYQKICDDFRKKFFNNNLSLSNDKYQKVKFYCMNYRFNDAIKELNIVTQNNVNSSLISILFLELIKESKKSVLSLDKIQDLLVKGKNDEARRLIISYLHFKFDYKFLNLFDYLFKLDDTSNLAFDVLYSIQNNTLDEKYNYFIERFNFFINNNFKYESFLCMRILLEFGKLDIVSTDVKEFKKKFNKTYGNSMI